MKLYHGSLEIVASPKILPRADGHTCDFGIGFYTTTSMEQAERWTEIRKNEKKSFEGFVNEYEISDGIFENESLRFNKLSVLKFDAADERWLDFVVKNRKDLTYNHNYDLVFGKVANDRVYTTLNLYEDGFLNKAETLERLKTFVLVDQLLFHTEKALKFLHFIGAKKI